MPQDTRDAISPLAPFEGSYPIPGFELSRRWFGASEITPPFRDEVLGLLRVAFNDQVSWFGLPVRPEDHFEWKFRDRPTGATAHTTVDADGRVVGFTGGFRRIWLVKGRPFVSRGGYDLALSPGWQGQGVQRALQPFSEREWHPSEDIGVGYVTHPADRHLAIESGNKAPANETHDYVRLLRTFRRAKALVRPTAPVEGKGSPAQLSRTAPILRNRERRHSETLRRNGTRALRYAMSLIARRPARRNGDWTISTLSRFEDRHAQFVSEAVSQFDFVADRPLDYLNWRYCDERAGPFVVRLAEQSDQCLGYAVTRVLRGRAYIADILALPGHAAVAESLIRDAIDQAERGEADSIRIRLPKAHPYRQALRRCGFFDTGHVAGELIAPRRVEAEELAFLDRAEARIHHVLADSDYV